jgi:hypothetical protein
MVRKEPYGTDMLETLATSLDTVISGPIGVPGVAALRYASTESCSACGDVTHETTRSDHRLAEIP